MLTKEEEMKKGFNKQEEEILNSITKAHNDFLLLPVQHKSDLPDWIKGIHDLQKVLGLRILRREHPSVFKTVKK